MVRLAPSTTKAAALLGASVGLTISFAVLALLWFGVLGVLTIKGVDLIYIAWPSSIILTVGWRSTPHGVATTIISVMNCGLYGIIGILLRAAIAKMVVQWKSI